MAKWKFIYSLENMPSGYVEVPGENLFEEEALQIALEDGQYFLVVDVEKIEDVDEQSIIKENSNGKA